jgi:soluble lytic murein transglycosylase
MPTVPTYDSFQVSEATLPQVQSRAPQTPDTAARQAQQIGQTLTAVGNESGRIALQMQQEANQLRVDDALNKAKEAAMRLTYDKDAGFQNIKGINALERPDGRPLADEYGDTLRKQLNDITANLGNDMQRQAFSAQANSLLTSFRGQIVKHEASEFQNYALSVREGTINTRLQEIALNYNNPEAIDTAVTSIKAAVYDQSRLLGKSAEWADAQARSTTSRAHKVAVAAALENNDLLYADGYLKRYGKQMEAGDLLQVRGLITKEMDLQVGTQVGAQVFESFAPRIQPTEFDRLQNIVTALGGTEQDDGKLGSMLQRYEGDVTKALAAYNWGEKEVDAAIKADGDNWLAKAPEGTRAFVERGAREFGTGGGAPKRPTLAEMKAELRNRPELANNPSRLKAAESRLESSMKDMEEAIKQRGDEALAQAQAQLIQNGGRFSALPIAVRNQIPSGQLDNLYSFAKKVAEGEPIQTDWQLYYTLKTNPQLLGQTNLGALRSKLSDTEFKNLTEEQQGVRSGKDEALTRVRTTKEVLSQYMREAGIDPTPKDDDKKEAAKVGRIYSEFEARVRAREQAEGRKLKPEEMEKEAAKLFTSVEIYRSAWFNDERPAALVEATDRIVVPETDRAQIIEALGAAKRPVDEVTIANLYRARMGIPLFEEK